MQRLQSACREVDSHLTHHIQVLVEDEFYFVIVLAVALDLSGACVDLCAASTADGKLSIHSKPGTNAFLYLFIRK